MDVGIAVGDSSVLLYASDGWFTKLVHIGEPGGPMVDVDVVDGIGDAVAVPGTDQFIVQPNAHEPLDDMPPRLTVYPFGTTRAVASGPLAVRALWSVRFLPSTGDMLIPEAGGVYVVDAAGGAVRRVSDGDLVAVGENHFLVRECDATLVCGHVRVDAGSGERVAFGSLDGLVGDAVLAPDGSSVTYVDWEGTPPTIRLVDLVTGDDAEVGRVDHSGFNYRAVWAADSSGMFLGQQGDLVFFDRETEQRIPVFPAADLGVVMALAAHRATDDSP